MYERVVYFKNAVETLGVFSEQIAEAFAGSGIETYEIDYEQLYAGLEGVRRFLKKGKAALLTFNFIGLQGEDIFLGEDGRSIWERNGMRILNILVDHPMYYHSMLAREASDMQVFCIDRGHVAYVRRFYPHVMVEFLPSAGNCCETSAGGRIPMENRTYDVVFTGNYVPTSLFEKRLAAQGEEYKNFYLGMIDDLMEHPDRPMDAVLEEHIVREVGAVSREELAAALGGLIFVDQWVRSEMRSRVIASLAEADIPLYLVGAEWEHFPWKKSKRIRYTGKMVSSFACMQAVAEAKIALNVMPWFKDGAHDRIFTSMLLGTACVTDDSRYLREQFTDGRELFFYSVEAVEKLPGRIHTLLEHPDMLAAVAERGYKRAAAEHTWRERANVLLTYL